VVVTYVMVALCLIAVLGTVGSIQGYDRPYGGAGSPMRIPRHSARRARRSRRSRQLRALETALEERTPVKRPGPCAPVRSHGRRSRG
jgi:hypothetical protein